MITNLKELILYIKEDKKRNMVNCTPIYLMLEPVLALFGAVYESYYIRKYLRTLRILEFLINKGWGIKIFYKIKWKRLSNKYQIYIQPNTVGKGLYIPHFNGGIQLNCFSMGDYCTVTSGVVIGNKGSQKNRATIGNNVSFTVGSKAIGKITIGDNVIICPNSVIIENIPANAIVSRVPAKIIKIKE